MTINSIKTVHAEFFKVFLGTPIVIQQKANNSANKVNFTVPVVFASASGNDYSQKPVEVFPVISIQDYIPVPSTRWKQNWMEYIDGYTDTNNDGVFDEANIYQEPIELEFRYDVSIATKSRGDYDQLIDYMFKTFGVEGPLMFLAVQLPDTTVGIPIWYKVTTTPVYRTDGVTEVNYEFKFNCFVDIKDPQTVQLIDKLNVTLNS
jgi:hypothetical protein